MANIMRLGRLIEFLEQFPEDSLVTVCKDSRLELPNVIYLEERNTIVFLPCVKEQKKVKDEQKSNRSRRWRIYK